MINRILCFLAWVAVCANVCAQETNLANLLLKEAPKRYIGQYADNSSARNGVGIADAPKGGLYIGDFNRNKYGGKGMLISGGDGAIANAPEAYVYVGGWIKGKKHGRGICYAPNGDLIYEGRFEDDKPIDVYPSVSPNIHKYFSMMETPDGLFIGEIIDGILDGFGLCLQSDGTYWVGMSKEGERNGLSIFFFDPYVWQTVRYTSGSSYEEITSSADYNARNSKIKEMNAKLRSELLSAVNGIVSVGVRYAELKGASNNASMGTATDGVVSGGSAKGGSSKGGSAKASSKKGNDCGTAWMSDSRVYSDYETQLVKGGQSVSDREHIRSKMRGIRKKWESRGCPMSKSPHE